MSKVPLVRRSYEAFARDDMDGVLGDMANRVENLKDIEGLNHLLHSEREKFQGVQRERDHQEEVKQLRRHVEELDEALKREKDNHVTTKVELEASLQLRVDLDHWKRKYE